MTGRYKKHEKYNKLKPIHFIIFFIVIFISDDTVSFGTNENSMFFTIKYIVYSLLILYLFKFKNVYIYHNTSKQGLYFMGCFVSIFLPLFLNQDLSGGYFYQFMIILLAFFITQFFPSDLLAIVYIKFIYVISFISIIIVIIANLTPELLNMFPVTSNSNGVDFYNIGISVVFKDAINVRNTGIFREPGVFMIYINLAVILQLFYLKINNKGTLLILISALVLTFSTAGYITLFLILFASFFENNQAISKGNKIILFITFTALLLFIYTNENLYSMVFEKIEGHSVKEGSSLARIASVFVNYEIFLDNPFKGVGIGNYKSSFENYAFNNLGVGLDANNNTNTITTIFAIYGVFLGTIFMFLIFNLVKRISKTFVVRIILFTVFVMFLSNEELRYSLMIFVILFWGLKTERTINGNKI